jgi:pimeloyl-ACP methyl ester carboxylesterase
MRKPAKAAAPLLLLAALAGACSRVHLGRPEGSCTHIQAVRQVQGISLCEDAWTCTRPPNGRFDRVGLHRLAACEGATGPIVLYLPGMHMNGELPIVEPRHDLRAYLAVNGVRTWGLDYRTHVVPPEASPQDLEALSGWTADVFASDVAWAAGFVRGTEPGPLYLAGFSHGAALAYRVAARRGERFAGLLILDGALPAGAASDRGGPAIDVGGNRLPFAERQQLLAAVAADPGRASPVPGFTTAGEALAQILHTSPAFGGNGGLANTRDGVSDLSVLAMLLRSYDRWWPRASLEAGPLTERPTAPVPVLAFASSRLGPEWTERVRASARAFGGPDAVVRELPAYGHLDVLVGRRAARDVFEPSLAWLVGGAPQP